MNILIFLLGMVIGALCSIIPTLDWPTEEEIEDFEIMITQDHKRGAEKYYERISK